MEESRRQKKVASLIKEVLSQILIDTVKDRFGSSLITITRITITKDLKTAHVYLSLLGKENREPVLDMLNERVGYFRKYIASRTDLKYNPPVFTLLLYFLVECKFLMKFISFFS